MAKFNQIHNANQATFDGGVTVKEFFTRLFETCNENVVEMRIRNFNELYTLSEFVYEKENQYSGNAMECVYRFATVTIFQVYRKEQLIRWRTFPESDNPQYHNCPRSILKELSPERLVYGTDMERRQARRWREACKDTAGFPARSRGGKVKNQQAYKEVLNKTN